MPVASPSFSVRSIMRPSRPGSDLSYVELTTTRKGGCLLRLASRSHNVDPRGSLGPHLVISMLDLHLST